MVMTMIPKWIAPPAEAAHPIKIELLIVITELAVALIAPPTSN